jgi:hypothetical protein
VKTGEVQRLEEALRAALAQIDSLAEGVRKLEAWRDAEDLAKYGPLAFERRGKVG